MTLMLDVAPTGAVQDAHSLRAVTEDAAACAVRIARGGLSLAETGEEISRTLRTLDGVDMVAVTLFGVPLDPTSGWHRLGDRGWLHQWTAPDVDCSCVPKAGDPPPQGLRWLSQQAKSDLVAVPDIDQLPDVAAADRAELTRYGVRSMVSAAVMHDGTRYGAVTVYRTGPGTWPEQHVADTRLLAAALAAHAATLRARDELASALLRADRARDRQRELFAEVGTGLRTPLAEVLGTAEVLAEEARATAAATAGCTAPDRSSVQTLAATVEGDAAVIARGGRQLLTVVDDLLAAARTLSDSPPSSEAVTVADAVADVEHWVRTTALLRQVTVSIDVDPAHRVLSTPTAVRQVLTQLVGNAVVHNRAGGHVHISAASVVEHGQAWVRVAVRDTGPGLPPDQHDEVFRPFVRYAEPGTPGTGLGLTLARSLTERDGGIIGVESTAGLGTCFWVDLPTPPGR